MEDQQKIAELRAQIDGLDEKLVELLNERAKISLRIRVAKGDSSIYRPEREAQVVEHVSQVSTGPLSTEAIATLFHTIIYVCRSIQEVEVPAPGSHPAQNQK